MTNKTERSHRFERRPIYILQPIVTKTAEMETKDVLLNVWGPIVSQCTKTLQAIVHQPPPKQKENSSLSPNQRRKAAPANKNSSATDIQLFAGNRRKSSESKTGEL